MTTTVAFATAWRMLVHDRARLALSVAGVAFASLCVFMSIGIFNGLNDSTARAAAVLNADLAVISRWTRSMEGLRRFDRSILHRLRACDQVQDLVPVVVGPANIRNTRTGMRKRAHYFAFPGDSVPFTIPGSDRQFQKLCDPGTLVFDSSSRDVYGDVREGRLLDVNGASLRVVGTIEFGPSPGKNGYVFLSDATVAAQMREADSRVVSLGLVRGKPGSDVEALKIELQRILGDDATVLTPAELWTMEVRHTTFSTPFGALLGIAFLASFFVGICICYQILYNEVTDHVPQFATLRAVGFSDAFLRSIVLDEAVLLVTVGFLPGTLAARALYTVVQQRTKIHMELTGLRIAVVFFCCVVMSILAGLGSLKKALCIDPADLY